MQAIVLGVCHKPSRVLAAPVNDKRQLIKGLVLWEMYPLSRLLNQSQPFIGKGIPKGCCGSYVLISSTLLHQDGDCRGKLWENHPSWIPADSNQKKWLDTEHERLQWSSPPVHLLDIVTRECKCIVLLKLEDLEPTEVAYNWTLESVFSFRWLKK